MLLGAHDWPVGGRRVLKFLTKLALGFSIENRAGLPKTKLALLYADLRRLRKKAATLPEKLLRYAVDGEGEDVVLTLGGIEGCGEALQLVCCPHPGFLFTWGQKTRRQRLLQRAGVTSVTDYRQMALASARKMLLVRQREKLTDDITAALSGVCDESAIADCFVDKTSSDLEKRWEQLTEQVERDQVKYALEEIPVFLNAGEATWIVERYRNDDWKSYAETRDVAMIRFIGPARVLAEAPPEKMTQYRDWYDESEWLALFGTAKN